MALQYFHRYVVPDDVKQQALRVMDDNIHYLGPHTRALEAGLAARFGKKHAVSTHAGHAAYETQIFGYKMYLNEIQAAVGAHQLSIMEDWIATRRRNAATYTQLLSGLPVETPPEKPYAWSSYLHYVIRTDARDSLRNYLVSKGVEAKMHYPLPIHLHAAFTRQFGFKRGAAPVAERFCDRVLSLPVAPHVSEADIHGVVGHIRTFFDAAVVRAQ